MVSQKGIQSAHLSFDWHRMCTEPSHPLVPLVNFSVQRCIKPWEDLVKSFLMRCLQKADRACCQALLVGSPESPMSRKKGNRNPTSKGTCMDLITSHRQPGALCLPPTPSGSRVRWENTYIKYFLYKSQSLDHFKMGAKVSYYYHFSKTSLNEYVTKQKVLLLCSM